MGNGETVLVLKVACWLVSAGNLIRYCFLGRDLLAYHGLLDQLANSFRFYVGILLPAGGRTAEDQPPKINWPHHYRNLGIFYCSCCSEWDGKTKLNVASADFFSQTKVEFQQLESKLRLNSEWIKNLLEQLPIFSSLTQLTIWDSDFAVGILCSYSTRWRQLGTCAHRIGFEEVLSAGSEFLTHRTR